MLAYFTNTTGESIFDDTLRQALSERLAQSPFLSLFPDSSIVADPRHDGPAQGRPAHAEAGARSVPAHGQCGEAADEQENWRRVSGHVLALWKNADPDVPALKQAKVEYARLAGPQHF